MLSVSSAGAFAFPLRLFFEFRLNRRGESEDFAEDRREFQSRTSNGDTGTPISMVESAQRMKTRKRPAARARKLKQAQSRPALSKFARLLLREWRRLQLPLKNERTIVGVSGGADSVALLMAIDELINARKLDVKLIVSHVDHQLRKTSGEDARWVK